MPRSDQDIIIQSLGIAADYHSHDAAIWAASKNIALQPAIENALRMARECEALRDRLLSVGITLEFPPCG